VFKAPIHWLHRPRRPCDDVADATNVHRTGQFFPVFAAFSYQRALSRSARGAVNCRMCIRS